MGTAESAEKPIRLFYSYSHNDEGLRKKLEDHLAVLRWSGMISEWHDRNIDVGEEWAKEIDRNLSSADIILLLVSASFIASAYCWSVEVKKALERHEKGEAKVIPVILRPCVWDITPFAKLQAAPTDAKPVTSWSDPDAALCDVAGKIERAATDLRQQRRHAAEEAHHRAEEARKSEEAEAGQVAEQQQREALQRREQDEARRAVEAKAARVPKTARNNDARGQQRLKLIAAVVLSVAVGLIIVAAHLLQQGTTPKPEPQRPAETAPKEEKKPAVAAPAPAPTPTPKPEPQRPAETAPKEEKKPAVAVPTPAPTPTRRALKPLDTFTDCGECPEMVVIPGGTFMMGSPANEPERKPNEGPQHRVTIPPFAMGKTEVTFAEWDACVAAGGCSGYKAAWTGPGITACSQGFLEGCEGLRQLALPTYWKALSVALGSRVGVRLPGQRDNPLCVGDAITPKDANYAESMLGKTTEVGAYPPNAWGLYDMHGNVWEWVEDWYDSYQGASTDGSAWTEGDSSSRDRVIRGGSWLDLPWVLRSAFRNGFGPEVRGDDLGFRVARTLD